jgi:sigma-E factor negative regulatory protein RseA
MNERISRLMDGELDDAELPTVLSGLKETDGLATWACYHAIGDVLRRDAHPHAFALGLAPALAARLRHEPTVLAPQRPTFERTASWAWAAAATLAAAGIVAWTAMSMVGDMPAAIAKAGEAGTLRAAQLRPSPGLSADYLVAHQEYSPSSALQVVGPYLRAAAVQVAEPRP